MTWVVVGVVCVYARVWVYGCVERWGRVAPVDRLRRDGAWQSRASQTDLLPLLLVLLPPLNLPTLFKIRLRGGVMQSLQAHRSETYGWRDVYIWQCVRVLAC